MTTLLSYLARFLVLIFILPAHEFAHAFVAHLNGDDTAKFYGRMTLNPLKHFDPIGLVSFVLVGFGWAKPVPVNPNNFRNYKMGSFWVAVAGVITNFILAFLFYPLYVISATYIGTTSYFGYFLTSFFLYGFVFDLSFCVFNLIPVYPLDGFRVVDTFSRKRGKFYQFLRYYGHYILLGLILLSFVADMFAPRFPRFRYIDILGYLMTFAKNIVGFPITAFWNFIFGLF